MWLFRHYLQVNCEWNDNVGVLRKRTVVAQNHCCCQLIWCGEKFWTSKTNYVFSVATPILSYRRCELLLLLKSWQECILKFYLKNRYCHTVSKVNTSLNFVEHTSAFMICILHVCGSVSCNWHTSKLLWNGHLQRELSRRWFSGRILACQTEFVKICQVCRSREARVRFPGRRSFKLFKLTIQVFQVSDTNHSWIIHNVRRRFRFTQIHWLEWNCY